MNGLFLVHNLDSPSCRYRVLQYLPHLEQQGVVCDVRRFPKSIGGRLRLFRRLGDYDFVVIHRKRFGPLWTWYLRRKAKSVVFDFDDAIMFHDSHSTTQQSSSRRRQFIRMVRAADLVFCGNEFIRRHAAAYNSNSVLLPTVIDVERYPQKTYADDHKITLGWIGSHSTLPYLRQLSPVFESLGCLRNDLELKIVCDRFFDLQNMPVQKVVWSHETEVAEIQSFDIGLMPLSDDVWSKGKCGLKILQCHAAGVPVVASPVGANTKLVEEGLTGWLAATHDDWVEKIERLADDALGRSRMGREGRRRVIESYSVQKHGPLVLQQLRDLAKAA